MVAGPTYVVFLLFSILFHTDWGHWQIWACQCTFTHCGNLACCLHILSRSISLQISLPWWLEQVGHCSPLWWITTVAMCFDWRWHNCNWPRPIVIMSEEWVPCHRYHCTSDHPGHWYLRHDLLLQVWVTPFFANWSTLKERTAITLNGLIDSCW